MVQPLENEPSDIEKIALSVYETSIKAIPKEIESKVEEKYHAMQKLKNEIIEDV